MCGIFGYKGDNKNAGQIVVEGLKRLDYRGYDSWGVGVLSEGSITVKKEVGKISEIKDLQLPSSTTAMAHTRWATTGAVNQVNAHPHYSTDRSFVLAQNGIVENFESLKKMLIEKGYRFISETDTEVIVRLIEDELKTEKEFIKAVRSAFLKLQGRNTIIVLTKTGDIFAARNGSPLVVGLDSKTHDVYVSSDTLSFAPYANRMIVLENYQMVTINNEKKISIFEIKTGREIIPQIENITIHSSKIDKEGYPHFMLKEIHEAPFVINQLVHQKKEPYEELAREILKAANVYTIGSGGAGVAASQVAFYLREFGKVRATALIGADAVEYSDLFSKGDLIIVISQSGETADVLEVIEPAKKRGVKIASFVNMPGSMITRMSDFKFMSESGPEICVMSTKTFDAQIAFGYLLAKTVAGEGDEARTNLKKTAVAIDEFLKNTKVITEIKSLAKLLAKQHDVFLLGKYQNFHIIREGMVKVIEASYKHGHALPSGDLKHYVITLMEPGVHVIAVMSNDKTKSDVLTAIEEVRLRGAKVVAIAPEKHEAFDYFIPVSDTGETSAIANLIPLQLLAYYMAIELGNNVDKPRNIAKSVTVK